MLSSSKARNPLDLNGADFSALMKDVVRLLAEFLDHLPNAPFIQPADRFALLRDPFMRPARSESGRPLRELLEIISRAADNDLNTASGSALTAIPGMVDTDIRGDKMSHEVFNKILSTIPMGRIASPREIASVFLFLASDLSSFVTGATIDVNGGMFIH